MSRRHAAEKREDLPDAKFGDKVLTKFMNNLMIDGTRVIAPRNGDTTRIAAPIFSTRRVALTSRVRTRSGA